MEQESDDEDDNQNVVYEKKDYIGKNMVSHSFKDPELMIPPV